ncbi:hypothetical protein EVAR_57721_1 [Eumeta japonica]|uniref:Uncharacterized protein n=1 Tax=Eumeta variegata TaxID=151549 RepID=A0A4C1Y9X5_EUMVA|nr:hypothetical protein EVAR_57721_1 [Eumeta japonica]
MHFRPLFVSKAAVAVTFSVCRRGGALRELFGILLCGPRYFNYGGRFFLPYRVGRRSQKTGNSCLHEGHSH